MGSVSPVLSAQDEVLQEGAMLTVVAYNLDGGRFEEALSFTTTPSDRALRLR